MKSASFCTFVFFLALFNFFRILWSYRQKMLRYFIAWRNTFFFLSLHIGGGLYGYYSQNLICNDFVQDELQVLRTIYFTSTPYLSITFIGFLILVWRVKPKPQLVHHTLIGLNEVEVYFRYVTKGKNPDLIIHNVGVLLELLKPYTFIYHIEVVTDLPILDLVNTEILHQIIVPDHYEIFFENSPTKYKARALQYALENSQAKDQDCLVHLDEETLFTLEFVNELLEYLVDYKKADTFPIGQGCIKYYRPGDHFVSWQHLFTTLADSLRISDDHARFQLQFHYGKCWFGIKGSFIVIQNAIEKRIGFNYGFNASITEDTFFAFRAAYDQVPFHYFQSSMYEKSPFTLKDFMHQRRRWFNGLWKVSRSSHIYWVYRYILKLMLIAWILAPFSWLITLYSAITCARYLLPVEVILGIMLGSYLHIYIHGFIETFHFCEEPLKYGGLFILQVLFVPLFSLLETASIIFALLRPSNGFYIVQKSVQLA